MQVPGQALTHPLVGRMEREGLGVKQMSDIPVEMAMKIETAYIAHHDQRNNFRPYLRMRGEMRSIRPYDILPGNITEIAYQSFLAPNVDVFYEFNDAQLQSLIAKGYFTEGFKAPEDILGENLEITTSANAVILEGRDDEVPLIFVDVPDRSHLVVDEETSGYDMAQYFTTPVRETELENVEAVPTTELEDILTHLPDSEETEYLEKHSAARDANKEGPSAVDRALDSGVTTMAAGEAQRLSVLQGGQGSIDTVPFDDEKFSVDSSQGASADDSHEVDASDDDAVLDLSAGSSSFAVDRGDDTNVMNDSVDADEDVLSLSEESEDDAQDRYTTDTARGRNKRAAAARAARLAARKERAALDGRTSSAGDDAPEAEHTDPSDSMPGL